MTRGIAQFLRILSYARPYRRRLLIAMVSLVFAAGLGLIYPTYFGDIIDAAFMTGDVALLERWSLTLLAVFAGQAVFIYFRHYLVSWVGERTVADLRVELYAHLLTLSPEFFQCRRTGEIASRLAADVSKIQRTVSTDLSVAARNTITLVGGVAILAWADIRLTCMMLMSVPPVVLVSSLFGRTLRRLANASQNAVARANGDLHEGVAGIETVQAFAREGYELKRYAGAIASAFELARQRIKAGSWFTAATSLANFSVIVVLLYAGSRSVIRGDLSPGELTRFILYTMIVANAVEALAGLWANIHSTLGATARVFEILDSVPAIHDPPDPLPLHTMAGSVRFERVSFAYDSRMDNALDKVDFEIPAGSVCALVGPSGAGKTTLARLLYRFHDPGAGCITIEGNDLAFTESPTSGARSRGSRKIQYYSRAPSSTTFATAGSTRAVSRSSRWHGRLTRTSLYASSPVGTTPAWASVVSSSAADSASA